MPFEVVPKPGPTWDAKQYCVRRVERVGGVEDGHVIDLGDRAFQVRSLTHSLTHDANFSQKLQREPISSTAGSAPAGPFARQHRALRRRRGRAGDRRHRIRDGRRGMGPVATEPENWLLNTELATKRLS